MNADGTGLAQIFLSGGASGPPGKAITHTRRYSRTMSHKRSMQPVSVTLRVNRHLIQNNFAREFQLI